MTFTALQGAANATYKYMPTWFTTEVLPFLPSPFPHFPFTEVGGIVTREQMIENYATEKRVVGTHFNGDPINFLKNPAIVTKKKKNN